MYAHRENLPLLGRCARYIGNSATRYARRPAVATNQKHAQVHKLWRGTWGQFVKLGERVLCVLCVQPLPMYIEVTPNTKFSTRHYFVRYLGGTTR
jgi:hypothetical protein